MEYLRLLEAFEPDGAEEAADRRQILDCCRRFPDTVLTRQNALVHLTSSGLVMDPALKKVLLVYHNIYKSWSWTGGHCDGDPDLLAVALREAAEETGLARLRPLTGRILGLDVLPVWGHFKRGQYVSSHLHLSVAFVLVAEEGQPLRQKPDENSGVAWFGAEELPKVCSEPQMLPVYNKLIARARQISPAPV